jgi:uncharacterized protein (TIGR02611 family)
MGWHKTIKITYRTGRRIVVAAVGTTVLIVGVALIFLPGPAFVVIPTGLAILGLEFAWARRWLRKLRQGAVDSFEAVTKRRARNRQQDKDSTAPLPEYDRPTAAPNGKKNE